MATPVLTALPPDVERRLADLVGIDAAPVADDDDLPLGYASPYDESKATQFRRRVLHVAEQITLGGLLLLAACAALAARTDSQSLDLNPIPLMGWGLAAAVCAVGLAAMVTDPTVTAHVGARKRRVLGVLLMLALLVSLAGVVVNADGLSGPAWVLFLPLVVVTGAVLGSTTGLGVGALAAGGIYVATVLSGDLTGASIGMLVVILPVCPMCGWAAGALATMAHDAMALAQRQRAALAADVGQLAELLEVVASGDLSRPPSLEQPADQATAQLAVAFADTVLSLRRLVRQLAGVADHLASNAAELSTSANSHLGAVEHQSSAVSQTTSTIEELAATATAIATTAQQVAIYAAKSRHDVDLGIASVSSVSDAMGVIRRRVAELGMRTRRLDERVTRIAATTRMIDELGRRTTMLAVNASIEAARVGEQGAGFATVAAEIAALAGRARAATADISGIVAELEQGVEDTAMVSQEGIAAVEAGLVRQREVDYSLEQISARVDDTTFATDEITRATQQQRSASDAVVAAMHTVTSASENAMAATRNHADAATRLHDLMESLSDTVGKFRLE